MKPALFDQTKQQIQAFLLGLENHRQAQKDRSEKAGYQAIVNSVIDVRWIFY